MGDLIATAAVRNGWAGVVVYGAVRDVDVEVTFGGVVFRPGSSLVSDEDGVVVLLP